MRPRKYHINLTQEEYNELLQLVKKGTTQAYKITHAQVLLKLDESFNEKPWNVEAISDKIAFRQLCVTLCGRFGPDEGGVVGCAD